MQLVADRWYAVLGADEVPRGKTLGARRLGLDLVFWRDAAGRVAGALDRCPHRGAALSPGRVLDGCVECPFHGFRFDGNGACTAIPAHPDRKIPKAMHLDALALREEQGLIWVWTGPSAAPSDPVPFFDFQGWSWRGSQSAVDVKVHYTRAVENQLDFIHLPFVHRTTIGRGLSPSQPFENSVDGDRIRLGFGDGFLELLGPNIWRLKTGPVFQFLVFAPVDEDNMRYYLRSYQRMVKVPGLDWVVGKVSALSSGFIMDQDTRVVETQPRGETRLRMGEVLIPGDAPIIAYRRWREERRAPFEPGGRRPLEDGAAGGIMEG